MYGFRVTKDEKEGTVISSPSVEAVGTFAVVVWDDQTFTTEEITGIKAMPIPVEGALADVLSMVPTEH